MRGAFPNAREILVTVPARQEIWSDYDNYYAHVQRYSRGSLEAAPDAQAIRTSDSGYFFHSLYFPRARPHLGEAQSGNGRAYAARRPRVVAALADWPGLSD